MATAAAPAVEHAPAPRGTSPEPVVTAQSELPLQPAAAPKPVSASPSAPAPQPVARAPEFKPYTLPADAGLVMVETTSAPAPAEPEPAAESAAPRRTRPPRPVIADEPLVMVETSHKQ
jgi:hypothetical protein